MSDLIEPAFRRAQEKASEVFAYLQFTPDADKSNIGEKCARALITAYLDDPDVLLAAADGLDILADHNTAMAVGILKAIGAKGVE